MNQISACRLCLNSIVNVNDFGTMPIANGFHYPNHLDNYRYELKTGFCESCKLFQLIHQPVKELMFHEAYPFFTSVSKKMVKHFQTFVEQSILPYVKNNSNAFVVEIGSNDGTLLQFLKDSKVRHLGIDPSANVVRMSTSKGLSSEVGFFDLGSAVKIKKEHGHADVIVAANVICHLPDLNDLFKGIKELLAEDGVFIFEEPYLLDMFNLVSFDQIYDEHVYIFSLMSVINICSKFELELIDAIPQITHGGSMRYFVSHKGRKRVDENVNRLFENEIKFGLNKLETYLLFSKNCEKKKLDIENLISGLKMQGKIVSGYGATSKSTTILNYCNLSGGLIDYICDSTPEKIGKVTPATKIPIVSIEHLHLHQPDYLILFAWNHEQEIFTKEKSKLSSNVKWIKFVPEVEIYGKIN